MSPRGGNYSAGGQKVPPLVSPRGGELHCWRAGLPWLCSAVAVPFSRGFVLPARPARPLPRSRAAWRRSVCSACSLARGGGGRLPGFVGSRYMIAYRYSRDRSLEGVAACGRQSSCAPPSAPRWRSCRSSLSPRSGAPRARCAALRCSSAACALRAPPRPSRGARGAGQGVPRRRLALLRPNYFAGNAAARLVQMRLRREASRGAMARASLTKFEFCPIRRALRSFPVAPWCRAAVGRSLLSGRAGLLLARSKVLSN